MNISQLQRVIVDALEDVKAQDIKVYNTTHLTSLFDRVIIASGNSNRQTKALAASVRDAVKENGGEIISTEGEDVGEWVLVDCGDAVVHLMQPAIRAYYTLEEIWGDKPVRVKLASEETAAARKAALGLDDDNAVPARKTAAKKTTKRAAAEPTGKEPAAKKTAARKTGTKTAAKTGAKAPAKTASAKSAKATPAKTAARKTGTVRHK
jgi:ribosome-associated protein